MSLEDRIEELHGAVCRLDYAVRSLTQAMTTQGVLVAPPNDEIKPVVKTEVAKVADEVGYVAPAITYEDVKKATLALAQAKGRDAVVELLQVFGCAKAQALAEDQWASYMAAVEAGLQ